MFIGVTLHDIVTQVHSILCFQVIWRYMFGHTSRDHGTMGYFKGLLNRTPVKKDPKKDVNACQDFLLTVVKGHLLAAACTYLGVNKLDSPLKLPLDIYKKSNAEQYPFLEKIATQVVNNLTVVQSVFTGGHVVEYGDGVYNFARALYHYGALVMEFLNAWHEGDGPHVYRCWRMFLPHVSVAKRWKYAIEALQLQMQVQAVVSPHFAHHILWDCFINTSSGAGRC